MANMKIEHGKFYFTRGGDTVGPAYRHEGRLAEETWQIGDQWYDDQGVCSTGVPFVNDVVAVVDVKPKAKAKYDPSFAKAAAKISGYTEQSDAKIALVNEFKVDEERLLRKVDALLMNPDGKQLDGSALRWRSIARTHFEEGFMALNRAIFQPQRIGLPEDEPESQPRGSLSSSP